MPFHEIFLSTSRRRILTAVVVVVLLAIGGALYGAHLQRQHAKRVAVTKAVADRVLQRTERRFNDIPALTAGELAGLRKHPNKEHLEIARRLGITQVESRDDAVRVAKDRGLVRLENTPYYVVRELDYSIPYVTESTAYLLELLGIRFQEALRAEGLPPYRYVITSVTRTLEDQRKLRKGNVNAAQESSHWFGTTVDIHYGLFNYEAEPDVPAASEELIQDVLDERLARGFQRFAEEYPTRLKAILGRVITDLQREGKLLATYERRQPVYHITLGTRLPPPTPASDLTVQADEPASSDDEGPVD